MLRGGLWRQEQRVLVGLFLHPLLNRKLCKAQSLPLAAQLESSKGPGKGLCKNQPNLGTSCAWPSAARWMLEQTRAADRKVTREGRQKPCCVPSERLQPALTLPLPWLSEKLPPTLPPW
ncbi:unnamed protein product [Lepidochelys kempii]